MANLKNNRGQYDRELGNLFDEIPKSVFAAIAVSVLTSGGDQIQKAKGAVAHEWLVLHQNGIVPQPPTKFARDLAAIFSKEELAQQDA